MHVALKSEDATLQAGRTLAKVLEPGDVIALIGSLGAGKTTFVRGIAEGLQLEPGYRVTSPTFVYGQSYPGRIPLHHMDLYRVENEKHLHELGLEEMLGSDGVAVIEWFDMFPNFWKGDRLELSFSVDGMDSRRIDISGVGERGNRVASAWKVPA